jgi:hypothetical protein
MASRGLQEENAEEGLALTFAVLPIESIDSFANQLFQRRYDISVKA